MKRTLWILIVVALIANACDNNNIENDLAPMKTFRSYIQTYVDCKGENSMRVDIRIVKIDASDGIAKQIPSKAWVSPDLGSTVFSVDDDGILIDMYGHFYDDLEKRKWDTCIFYRDNRYIIQQAGFPVGEPDMNYYMDRKRGFDKYSALIGDTCFNRTIRGDEISLVRAIVTPLHSLTVAADRDFGGEYAAGSDLSDFFTVYFEDPYSIVKNGYKPVEGTFAYYEELPYAQCVRKARLPEANFQERPFIGDGWMLALNVAPEQTGKYVFNIKASFADGTVLEAKAPPVYIRGKTDRRAN
jgi:hypothetical protein